MAKGVLGKVVLGVGSFAHDSLSAGHVVDFRVLKSLVHVGQNNGQSGRGIIFNGALNSFKFQLSNLQCACDSLCQ